MRNIWTIARRELGLYFNTPAAYLVAFVILLILGILFYANLLAAFVRQFAPGVEIILSPLIMILLFGTAAITMRTIAEEQKSGTIELMLTTPVRDSEFVIGKWLGAYLFMLIIVAITWIFPIILNALVDPGIDQGPLLTGYLGIVLICAALTAVGVSISAIFSNQIAAFFATLGVYLLLWVIGVPSQIQGGSGSGLLAYLDFSDHFYNTLFRGVIGLTDIVYYVSMTALALLIGTLIVETRRWR
jgi:ABC-2 type transport system permease protein